MSPGEIYTIVVRTRYQRYIGEFVLHCHILDHEDQGMMQNVSIVIPNGVLNDTVNSHEIVVWFDTMVNWGVTYGPP